MRAGQVLGVWFTPVLWLSAATLIVARGPDGLWIGLALILAPLVALGMRPAAPASSDSVFPVVVLLVAVGLLFWANMILAGDAAAWLGMPRWQGIAVVVAGACLATLWRGAHRLVAALLLTAALAVSAPLIDLARAAGMGPLEAWAKVSAQPAFRFPASSVWVTRGLPLGSIGDRGPIRFDEEHRITAPSGGRLSARTADGRRPDTLEWTLAAGQSIVLRPGDRLLNASGPRVQFEPDKRVPGSPVSGVAWAASRPPDWPRSAGLLVTLVFGALALCSTGRPQRLSRTTVLVVAVGAVMALLWAQAWAVYSLLVSPDVFLGAVTADRLLALPAFRDDPARPLLQSLLVVGGLCSFLASSIVLRQRLGALDASGDGEIGHDLGLWTGIFTSAGLAAVWRLDCWSLAVLGLGAAASGLGAIMLGSDAVTPPAIATLAGSVGLVAFAGLTVMGHLSPGTKGLLGAAFAYPALAAVPAAFLTLRIGRALLERR